MLGRPWWRFAGVAAAAAALAAAGPGPLSTAATAPATAREAASSTRPVSAAPARGTPQLARAGNTTERVRQLAQCGATMYAAGTFTRIGSHGRIYRRSNLFSFKATSPFTIRRWNPQVNGVVNSITFSRGCDFAYIGGRFTTVHGRAARNLAKISTATGAVVAAFGHGANGAVETLARHGGHILVGGYFTSVNNSAASPYMTSLSSATGRDDGYLRLGISGHYEFPGAATNPTRAYNQQLSHNGKFDLVEGDFTSAGGQARQQVFLLRLGRSHGTVTGWTSPEFSQHCVTGHPFYVQAGSWSPDDSTIYVASTGFHPLGWQGTFPLSGLCDAAAAFPATLGTVHPRWVNYTGCYSLYSTAADRAAVYVGGHELYASNPRGCKSAGPGAVSAPGLGGLAPGAGRVLLNSRGTAGRYRRSRGTGADGMLLTRAGLWVASDNGVFANGRFHLSDMCGGAHGHAGICFLPYR